MCTMCAVHVEGSGKGMGRGVELVVIVQGIPEFVPRHEELKQAAARGKLTTLHTELGEILVWKPLK